MIIKLQIIKNDLQVITDDSDVTINYIQSNGDLIEIEISKPDPEINITPWQS